MACGELGRSCQQSPKKVAMCYVQPTQKPWRWKPWQLWWNEGTLLKSTFQYKNNQHIAQSVGATSSTWRARAWQTVCGVGIWGCGGGASCGMGRGMRKLRDLDLGSWILRTWTWNVEMYGSCRCIYVIDYIVHTVYNRRFTPWWYTPDKGQVRSTGINSGGTGGTNSVCGLLDKVCSRSCGNNTSNCYTETRHVIYENVNII